MAGELSMRGTDMENVVVQSQAPSSRPPHVAVLPTHGMGHLIPLAELAKRLAARHGFTFTFIIFPSSASSAQDAYLASLPPLISSVTLPPVDIDDLPADTGVQAIVSFIIARSVPAIRDALFSIKSTTNLVAFITDLFGADSFQPARDVGVPAYMFFTTNLLALSVMLHLPELDASTTCEYRDLPTALELPGCIPIPGSELISPLQDRSDVCYEWMVHHGKLYWNAEGILVNSFDDLEPGAAKVLQERKPGRPPVYTIGPLVQSEAIEGLEGSECLEWLDQQPAGSVMFVSFGSGGTLTTEQMAELALGLEESGHRFLWVVRSPSDHVMANYFDAKSKADPYVFLPAGFVEQTTGVGLLVPSWVPQLAVLSHEATGGFLTHCGWNSVLESMIARVPMVAWPLFAEQRQNALLVESAKVALRPRPAEDGVIRKDEVARVVKELMVGEKGKAARQRLKELQEAAAKVLEDTGASSKALDEVANTWKGIKILGEKES